MSDINHDLPDRRRARLLIRLRSTCRAIGNEAANRVNDPKDRYGNRLALCLSTNRKAALLAEALTELLATDEERQL